MEKGCGEACAEVPADEAALVAEIVAAATLALAGTGADLKPIAGCGAKYPIEPVSADDAVRDADFLDVNCVVSNH